MIANRELTLDDYLAMLQRRLKVILIPTLLAPLIGFAVSYAFAPRYTSQSLVLVEEQKVPEGYVKPVVTEDLSQRVGALQQRALSAERLRPLIEQLGLRGNVDDLIEQIRAATSVQAVQAAVVPSAGGGTKKKGRQEGPGFKGNFTGRNPREHPATHAGITKIRLPRNLKDEA